MSYVCSCGMKVHSALYKVLIVGHPDQTKWVCAAHLSIVTREAFQRYGKARTRVILTMGEGK